MILETEDRSRNNEETDMPQSEKEDIFIIAEIGQNHNGSMDLAKLLVDLVSRPVLEEHFSISLRPIDAVKLTKRDLNQELTDSAMQAPYDSPHSFGSTYGEHRRVLELTDEEHEEIYRHAKSKGVKFVETICNPGALALLDHFQPDYIKVASRDLTNLPLLQAIAETQLPTIISIGMHGQREIDQALSILNRSISDISIMHCVSEYPTHPENVNLLTIPYLRDQYPGFRIGYSDHTIGIAAPLAAVAMGARVIEKHVTIDRRMKGTDQAGSLGPDGVNRMTRDIRLYELSLGESGIHVSRHSASARTKLERSVATKRPITKGSRVTEDDIWMLSPGTGLRWSQRAEVVGKVALQDIPANELILKDMVGGE
jgi:3-deoxy-D-glycero-D-galacto-nononate 9-phosphate synthase